MDNRIGSFVMGFILILVGVVLFQALADEIASASVTGNKPNESIVITATNNSVVYETIDIVDSLGSTANTAVTALIFFGNSTLNTSRADINIDVEVNWTPVGNITAAGNFSVDGNYNISYYYLSDAVGQTSEDDLTAVTYFGTTATNTESAGITITEEVNWTAAGVITTTPLNFTPETYNITYTYLPDEYVKNSTARTLLPITNIFFAIAIMVIGLLLVLNGLKDIRL